jgi:GGDEF domain-containing protein
VVLLEDLTSASEIHLIAERLVESLAQPVTVAGVDTRIGCSVGITFDGPDATVDQLLAEADQAMYLAKNAGKGCYRFYADPDLSDLGTSR